MWTDGTIIVICLYSIVFVSYYVCTDFFYVHIMHFVQFIIQNNKCTTYIY